MQKFRTIQWIKVVGFIAALSCVNGSFKVDSSSILPDLIHFRSADFGYIPYGKMLSGSLVISKDVFGCTSDQKIEGNSFFITRIGGCSIIQKALVAQTLKMTLTIVIADHDDIDEVHMLNTGKADTVKLPVLLFSKTDGDKLLKEIEDQQTLLTGRCFFPRTITKAGPVKIDYWFDPLDSADYKFFYQFSSLHKQLGSKVKMNAHLALNYNYAEADAKIQSTMCVSNGKYCAHPPSIGVLSGEDVVLAGLAILCLQKEDSSAKLTQTLMKFDQQCLITKVGNFDTHYRCLKNVAKSMGYKRTNFEEQCFKEEFQDGDKNSDNDLLASEKQLFLSETVQIWPELYVNQRAIRGNIQSLQEIESAVCGGFSDPIPEACEEYFAGPSDDFSPGTIILMIILSAAFMFAILFGIFRIYYQRKFQQQIDGEVNLVISKYMAFHNEASSA